jgi:hypothetical protein
VGVVTAATKFATGWWSASRNGVGPRGRARAAATLIARGEFSIAVAGLAVASEVEPDLGPVAITYVFVLAVVGPVAARLADPVADRLVTTPPLRPSAASDKTRWVGRMDRRGSRSQVLEHAPTCAWLKGGAVQITGQLIQGGLSFLFVARSRFGSWAPPTTGCSDRRSRHLPSAGRSGCWDSITRRCVSSP